MSGRSSSGSSGSGTGSFGQSSRNSGSSQQSSGGVSIGNPGGGSTSSTSISRTAMPQVEYMPNVLGCACHGIRAPGAAPAANDAATKQKAQWKAGLIPGRPTPWVPGVIPSAPTPPGSQGTTPPKSTWVPGVIPGTQAPGSSTGQSNTPDAPTAPTAPAGPVYNPDAATHAEMEKIAAEANTELKDLYAKYPNFDAGNKRIITVADDKERVARLENLVNSLKDPGKANQLAATIQQNRDTPLYNHMGGLKFTSFLNQVNSNMEKNGTPSMGMTESERVALYGYTTGDYTAINSALRKEKGAVSDPGLAAYIQEATGAMKKIPDYQPPPGQENNLYRAIFQEPYPGWGKETFVVGKEYSDFAFASTATTDAVPGAWKLTIEGTANAKDVGPYSAWPGEKEVLTLPGTKYEVVSVNGNRVTLRPKP